MKTKDCYTELSIQIARLESKVDFLIEKLVNKETTVSIPNIGYTGCARCGQWTCRGNCSVLGGAVASTTVEIWTNKDE